MIEAAASRRLAVASDETRKRRSATKYPDHHRHLLDAVLASLAANADPQPPRRRRPPRPPARRLPVPPVSDRDEYHACDGRGPGLLRGTHPLGEDPPQQSQTGCARPSRSPARAATRPARQPPDSPRPPPRPPSCSEGGGDRSAPSQSGFVAPPCARPPAPTVQQVGLGEWVRGSSPLRGFSGLGGGRAVGVRWWVSERAETGESEKSSHDRGMENPSRLAELVQRGRSGQREPVRDREMLRSVVRFRFVDSELLAARYGTSRQQIDQWGRPSPTVSSTRQTPAHGGGAHARLRAASEQTHTFSQSATPGAGTGPGCALPSTSFGS